MYTFNQGDIRRQNLFRLWRAIQERPGITRQALASGTGLSLMTVTNLVDFLVSQGALSFDRGTIPARSRRGVGRRADSIALSDENYIWGLLDLTGRRFRFAILTPNMRVLEEEKFPDPGADYEKGLISFLDAFRRAFDRLLAGRRPIGVAVALPGPYDARRDRVNNLRIRPLNDVGLAALLRERVGEYSYAIDEDVKFAIRAQRPDPALGESAILYYLYIGEGVGGACALGDTVLRGLNAVAGDAGQLFAADGKSFEEGISLRAFAEMLGIADCRALPPDELLEAALRAAAEDGDGCERAIRAMARRVAALVYNVLWLIDPDRIVIDCPYAGPDSARFLEGIVRELTRLVAGRLLCLPRCEMAVNDISAMYAGAIRVLGRDWIDRILTEQMER